MTDIEHALHQARKALAPSFEARLDAELLLSHTLGKNRAYLFAHPEHSLSEQELGQYQKYIAQRQQGIPIAYLLGKREFWSLELKVNEHTLIPRHETEQLLELSLALLPDSDAHLSILDLGTGSGAIACALAKERPHWHVTACDFSEKALLVAEENAKNLGLTNIELVHSNWFQNLAPKHYHAIISNPPYIAEHHPHLQEGDVRFEPLSALVSGPEGLDDLDHIINTSYNWLQPGGLILLEHGYDQKIYVQSILNKLGYIKVQCWQDMQKHDRISVGWRPE